MASPNVGCFLRLVGGAQATYDFRYLQATYDSDQRSNISPFHYLSWKVKGRKKNHLPSRGISGGHLRLDGSIARICKKLVMPLPIIGQQQRINHCPFGMYGTIISTPLYYSPVGGVPQLISALLLILPACLVEELSHILRSLKLVLLHFIEDFLHCKVRSFF